MDTLLFGLFFLVYLLLFFLAIRLVKNQPTGSALFLLPVLAGLLYDNGIMVSGRYIGESAVLENAHAARYWIHAFFTPLLVLFAWRTLQQANRPWAENARSAVFACSLTTGLILLELFTVVLGLTLEPKWEYNVLNYSSTEAQAGPPLMVLIVSVVLLAASIVIWRSQKWKWFFIGTLTMILGSMVEWPVNSGAVTNFFELILLSSLLATAYFQTHQTNY